MKKTIIALTAATALVAGTMTAPTAANATPAWFFPALIVGGILATGTVIAASQANAFYGPFYEPRGRISVRPAGYCRVERVRTSRGWRQVEVC